MDPSIDRDQFNIPTLYTTTQVIKQNDEQLTQLCQRIAGARGYVANMKTRQMNSSSRPAPKALSLRERLVRDYRQIVEHGYTAAFYVAVGVCVLILAVGVYSMLRD